MCRINELNKVFFFNLMTSLIIMFFKFNAIVLYK